MRMDKINLLVFLTLIAITIISLYPAIAFRQPVVQTDGATHYTYAKLYVEKGLNAENPPYNKYGSGEEKVSDYPPFTAIFFGTILKIFGNDVFWINGGLGLIFMLIASVSLYFFVKELFKSREIALISIMFFALNLRVYYTLFVGIYPALIATCLSIPALYFSYKLFSSEKNNIINLSLIIAATAAVIFTYPVMGFYLIILVSFLWLGIKINEKIEIKFPKISIKIKESGLKEIKKILAIMIPIIIIFLFALSLFTINERRISWISEFRSEMFKSCPGYPCVWKYFPIMDGPLLVIFAILGFAYLFYKNKWNIIFLLLGGLAIVLLGSMVMSGIVYLIYRFYVLFSILLTIPASFFIYRLISIKEIRKIGILLLFITIFIQAAILGYFYVHVQPSISETEVRAANVLYQYRNSDILYLVKEKEPGSFRSFKWILIYAKSEHYETPSSFNEVNISDFQYIFINEKSKLTEQEKNILSNFSKIFDEGSVQIYKK